MSKRVLPVPNSYMDTELFWQAAKEKKYLLQRCDDTGRFQYPPRPISLYTGSRRLSWVEVEGRGRLYSWTLTRVGWPGHEDRVPYICAYVKLDEGVRVLCNLVNCDAEQLKIGMPMRLVWESLSAEINYPAFEPDRD